MKITFLLFSLLLCGGCMGGGGGGGGATQASVQSSPSDPEGDSNPEEGTPETPIVEEPFTPSIEFSFQGGEVTVIPITPTQTLSGNNSYAGSTTIEEQQAGGPTLTHTITWSFVQPNTNVGNHGELLYNGNLIIQVSPDAPAPRSFQATITFPSAAYTDMSIKGGATVKLNSNADGGILSCPGAGDLLSVTADDGIAYTLVFCPFNMSNTGGGTTAFPFPIEIVTATQPPATVVKTIGVHVSAMITPGDKYTATLAPVVQ